jgi:hypothetical protein
MYSCSAWIERTTARAMSTHRHFNSVQKLPGSHVTRNLLAICHIQGVLTQCRMRLITVMHPSMIRSCETGRRFSCRMYNVALDGGDCSYALLVNRRSIRANIHRTSGYETVSLSPIHPSVNQSEGCCRIKYYNGK